MKSSAARNCAAKSSIAISRNNRRGFIAILIGLLLVAVAVHADDQPSVQSRPVLKIVYPKEGQTVGAVDSTFVLGSIAPCTHSDQWLLTINGIPVPVDKDGGFLAWLPITPGPFVFRAEATPLGPHQGSYQHRQKTPFDLSEAPVPSTCSVSVIVPQPLTTYPTDTLRLGPEYLPTVGGADLAQGDRIEVRFQGTPGCRAWFSVPGLADSIPMAETAPRIQPYWGESVFGAGAVPDSLMIRGIYSGFYDIDSDTTLDSVRFIYHLAPPDRGEILMELILPPYEPADTSLMEYLNMPDTVATDSSSYTININNTEYPFAVQFVDSTQIIRHGPRKGYLAIHQPQGIEALAVGRIGDWYKIKLARTQFGWVNTASVEPMSKGILPPTSYLSSIRTYSGHDSVLIEFPLAGMHPFRIVEDDRRTLRIILFGVTSDTDWIRYDFSDSLIDLATWSQPEDGMYQFTLHLTHDVWSYDTFYRGNTFYFQLNRPPSRVHDLKGKRIVLDPGHSPDPGAIGPTGYTEAEANLAIALEVRKELEHAGATVIMTRSDTSNVPLYDRPAIAKAANADLFVSIHNNALPDGVNPWLNNGTSCYYYHPQSIDLARTIHRRMLDATELDDHGLFYGNLAVLRPTQYPAVLVECAFMIIPQQESLLKTDRFRHKIARAIRDGIRDFLKEYDRHER